MIDTSDSTSAESVEATRITWPVWHEGELVGIWVYRNGLGRWLYMAA